MYTRIITSAYRTDLFKYIYAGKYFCGELNINNVRGKQIG